MTGTHSHSLSSHRASGASWAERTVRNNTAFTATPLVPEIEVLQLRDDSPLWSHFNDSDTALENPRPYWAFAWGGGQVLARHVLDNPRMVAERCVLDFGTGCGIAAIAAAKAGARKVIASDIDQLALEALRLNAKRNKVHVRGVCADLIYEENPGWDVVMAGDIWYDSRMSRHGLRWLRSLAGTGVVVLTGDPGRQYSPSAGLEKLAEYPCRSCPDLEHRNHQTATVFRVLGNAGCSVSGT